MLGKVNYGPYVHIWSGDTYELYRNRCSHPNTILRVAKDVVTVYDDGPSITILDKGKIITSISAFWCLTAMQKWDIGTAHLYADLPNVEPAISSPWYDKAFIHWGFRGRATKQTLLRMLPMSFTVMGYLHDDSWHAYEQGARNMFGVKLPDGLKEGSRISGGPIFIPRLKFSGETISLEEASKILGKSDPKGLGSKNNIMQAKALCCDFYQKAHEYAQEHNLIIAETNFRLGFNNDGRLLFAGEVLTPDTSLFWDRRHYEPGVKQFPFDKKIARDFISCEKKGMVELPTYPIVRTMERYHEIYWRLTGDHWIG